MPATGRADTRGVIPLAAARPDPGPIAGGVPDVPVPNVSTRKSLPAAPGPTPDTVGCRPPGRPGERSPRAHRLPPRRADPAAAGAAGARTLAGGRGLPPRRADPAAAERDRGGRVSVAAGSPAGTRGGPTSPRDA